VIKCSIFKLRNTFAVQIQRTMTYVLKVMTDVFLMC